MAGELITRTNRVEDLTTGTRVLTINDAGGTFTNLGASAAVIFTLPTGCPVGLEFTFVVLAADYLWISTPDNKNGETIYMDTDTETGIAAAAIGHACTVVCLDSTTPGEQFAVKSMIGSFWGTGPSG